MKLQRFSHTSLSLALGVCLASPMASQEEKEIDPGLLRQTVMITASTGDGSSEHGSGVVLCQDNKKVHVLTAHHVLAGKHENPGKKVTLRWGKLEKVEVSFQGGSPEPVLKDALTPTTVKGEDLMILAFTLEDKLPPARIDAAPSVDPGVPQEVRPEILAVGYLREEAEPWVPRTGTLLPGGGRFIHHTGQIGPGFSGGPLFSQAGTLIGINIQVVSGRAIGAELGTDYGRALALTPVLRKITNVVPSKCLESANPLSELANDTYRQAMREISIKRWKRAADLMAQAVDEQPAEGGTVHLEGLRYTPYLPRFHHGLALYRLAGRTKSSYEAAKLYGEAIREWERSKGQGQIQANKRFRKLSRLLEDGYEKLERHSTPQTDEEKAKWAAAAAMAREERVRLAKAEAEEAEKLAAELAAEVAAAEEEARQVEAERQAEIERDRQREEQERRRVQAAATARAALRQVIAAAQPCARVREAPAGRQFDCLTPGTRVSLVEASGAWSRVRLADERTGWVASQLLETLPEDP